MKARFVYESLDFERSQDPKTSMGVGLKSRAFPIKAIKTYTGARWAEGEQLEAYLRAALASTLGAFPEYAKSVLFKKDPELKRPISETWNIPELIKMGFSGVIYNDIFVPFDYPKLEEYMSFERGMDPKEALGIGRLSDIPSESIKNAFACVRNYSLEDLENILRRIKAKSNIKLDGVPVERLSYNDWVDFNNKVVNGIKSLNRRKAKSEFPFQKGDLLKAIYKGRTYFGVYDSVDVHGRIKAKGYGIKLAFFPEKYTKATPEEEERFRAEGILREKNRMKSNIERAKMYIDKGYNVQKQLDSLLQEYENKFGERYEG